MVYADSNYTTVHMFIVKKKKHVSLQQCDSLMCFPWSACPQKKTICQNSVAETIPVCGNHFIVGFGLFLGCLDLFIRVVTVALAVPAGCTEV